ncbi:MAG: hypothetical protein C4321_00550, partial [Chloroflexota bacterium]
MQSFSEFADEERKRCPLGSRQIEVGDIDTRQPQFVNLGDDLLHMVRPRASIGEERLHDCH